MNFFEQLQPFLTSFLMALGAGIAGALLTIPSRIRKENERIKGLENGVRAILKDKIQKEYISICSVDRKFAKPYEKENVSNLYDAYVGLNGNGYIAKLYEQIMNKPVQKDGVKGDKNI